MKDVFFEIADTIGSFLNFLARKYEEILEWFMDE